MTFSKNIFFAFISVMLCGILVYAQNDTPASTTVATAKPKQEAKHKIDFEDELVEGSAQKPEFLYLFQKKNFNYKRLIRLRENFIPEMKKSSEEIQRLKGGR